MSFVISTSRLGRRRPPRKTPRVDAEIVFKAFVRTLERLRETRTLAATREKA